MTLPAGSVHVVGRQTSRRLRYRFFGRHLQCEGANREDTMERPLPSMFVTLAVLISVPTMAAERRHDPCQGLTRPACLGVPAPLPKGQKLPSPEGAGGCALKCESPDTSPSSWTPSEKIKHARLCREERQAIRKWLMCHPKDHD
jgi:hypothetical protein